MTPEVTTLIKVVGAGVIIALLLAQHEPLLRGLGWLILVLLVLDALKSLQAQGVIRT